MNRKAPAGHGEGSDVHRAGDSRRSTTTSPRAPTTRVLVADHGDRLIYAAICDGVRYTAPKIADSKLGAVLAPFTTESAAGEALTLAGAEHPREWVR